jgi:mannose-6-phosphate isomerase-like protein (cupin superfamily)
MRIPVYKHEDERRILIEWNKDIPIKRCKVIQTKDKCILGKHYHNDSDNIFYMLKGKGSYTLRSTISSRVERNWLFEGDCLFVPRGVVHTFELLADTIMLEAASEPYNKDDEIQVTE